MKATTRQQSFLMMLLLLLFTAGSCGNKKNNSDASTTQSESAERLPSPFSADSAYQYIERQVAFGPRVPNSEGHAACANYLQEKLNEFGLSVQLQETDMKAYDGTMLHIKNIIGSFNPEASKRVLLFAHWDTRPYADNESSRTEQLKPIQGADDGASGVGVLIEIARLLKAHPLNNLGIDIIFFDAEDYGVPEWAEYDGDSSATWALGTQYWTLHPHIPNYRADFGILLDMVGAKGATFYREIFSQEYAGAVTTRIWNTAGKLGHNNFFINKMGGAITDDHYFVNKNRGIPSSDIINFDPATEVGFGAHWHTHNDNMSIIEKSTLQAVGETVWQVLVDYNDEQH